MWHLLRKEIHHRCWCMWQSGCNSEWVSFLWNCHWKFKHVAAARNWNLKFTFPPIPNSAKLNFKLHVPHAGCCWRALRHLFLGVIVELRPGWAICFLAGNQKQERATIAKFHAINFLSQRSEQKTPPIQVYILQNVGFWALCQDLVGSNLCLPNQSELPLYWIWGHAWKTTYWGWGCSFCKLFSQVIILTWAFQWGSQWSTRIKVKLL